MPIVRKSHVVPQLMGEHNATAPVGAGETERSRQLRNAAHVSYIGDQVNEVCADPVAHLMDLVHVAVRSIN